jgi:uncharacterized repeat protein (TIGR01451 family)
MTRSIGSRGRASARRRGRRLGAVPPRRSGTARLIAAACLTALIALTLASGAYAASIGSAGPLTTITISPDLNCDVRHAGDSAPEWFGTTACGTLAVDQSTSTLYGPANIPAGSAASPRTAFTPVSQTGPSGSGTSADPFTVVTVVSLGTSGLTITQTDSYVVGQESYRTDVQIANSNASARSVRLYSAGDCFLQNSDVGFGRVDGAAIACTATEDPGSRIEQLDPLTAGSSYMEAFYSTIWGRIGSQLAGPNTCDCAVNEDNGILLSWDVTVPAGGSTLVSHLTTFSPLGVAPLVTSKTADSATVGPGGADGYTITIHNPNAVSATVTSISDTLPAGFTYVAGSTTGAATANPSSSGQTLTWSGSFAVAADGDLTLHFGVTVSSTPGTYTNSAGGEAGAVAVAPTGPTAPVTVEAATVQPTTLTVSPATGDFADATTVSAVLTLSTTSAPIAGKSVTLTLNGVESCTATTDATGTAACAVTPGEPAGTYPLTASFAGDATYGASNGSSTFVVTLEETALSYTGDVSAVNGQPMTLSGVLTTDGAPLSGRTVAFALGSGGSAQSCSGTTSASGSASCSIASVAQSPGGVGVSGNFAGDTFYEPASASATANVFAPPATGAFVIGDRSAGSPTVGNTVYFWGSQWAKKNSLSGGTAPTAMKGFGDSPTSVTCGSRWETRPGNSSAPPTTLPGQINVIVSTKVQQSGSTISGTIEHIVVVEVAPGYGPDPGHAGIGKIVGVIC